MRKVMSDQRLINIVKSLPPLPISSVVYKIAANTNVSYSAAGRALRTAVDKNVLVQQEVDGNYVFKGK